MKMKMQATRGVYVYSLSNDTADTADTADTPDTDVGPDLDKEALTSSSLPRSGRDDDVVISNVAVDLGVASFRRSASVGVVRLIHSTVAFCYVWWLVTHTRDIETAPMSTLTPAMRLGATVATAFFTWDTGVMLTFLLQVRDLPRPELICESKIFETANVIKRVASIVFVQFVVSDHRGGVIFLISFLATQISIFPTSLRDLFKVFGCRGAKRAVNFVDVIAVAALDLFVMSTVIVRGGIMFNRGGVNAPDLRWIIFVATSGLIFIATTIVQLVRKTSSVRTRVIQTFIRCLDVIPTAVGQHHPDSGAFAHDVVELGSF
jgi:hypothetical protein